MIPIHKHIYMVNRRCYHGREISTLPSARAPSIAPPFFANPFRIRTYKNTQGEGGKVLTTPAPALYFHRSTRTPRTGAAEDDVIKPESRWALRKMLLAIPLSATLIAFALPFLPPQAWRALAQSGSTTPVHCHSLGTQDEIPPDKLPVPQKLSGIGNVHIKITASPEAQMWFDQGLNLYHDFWEYESLRAFQQGVRVDPQCAMCYWGIYQAEIFRHSSSKHFADAALAKAVSLKGHASKAERLYIEASAAHEAEEKDKKDDAKEGDSREVQILRKLVKHSPKDTQARIFLAWTLMDGYDDDGNPRKGTKETLTILQGVLKDEPENSAANHYWIHSVEASPKPEQALHSAEILGRLAPTSGHMVHMPGHIFFRTGDYARAQQSFAASTQADEQYMHAQNVQVDDDWNYVHNLMYAIANLMEQGQLTEATALSAKLKDARGQLEASLYPWSPRDSITRLDPRLPVALRAGDWSGALELLKASAAAASTAVEPRFPAASPDGFHKRDASPRRWRDHQGRGAFATLGCGTMANFEPNFERRKPRKTQSRRKRKQRIPERPKCS